MVQMMLGLYITWNNYSNDIWSLLKCLFMYKCKNNYDEYMKINLQLQITITTTR